MNGEMDKLAEAVEREMDLLRALPPVVARPEVVERIKSAVVVEARRWSRSRRMLRFAEVGVSVAAAVLFAVGLAMGTRPAAEPLDPDRTLTAWAAAFDESGHRLTRLLDSGWVGNEYGNGSDEETELDDIFRSLDQSFDRLENL